MDDVMMSQDVEVQEPVTVAGEQGRDAELRIDEVPAVDRAQLVVGARAGLGHATCHELRHTCFTRFKQFRDLATRYAKRAAYYTSEVIIASIILRLK